MFVCNISLVNFRNFSSLKSEFAQGVNIICGDNAVGKTNLIEALYYLSLGRSFKKANDKEIIKIGENEGQLLVNYIDKSSIKHSLEGRILQEGKIIYFDEEKVSSIAKILGKLVCVVYSPLMVSLFRDEPSERRRFIDSYLSLMSDKYLYALTRQKKLLKERNNALLNNYDEDVISIITEELVNISYRVYFLRKGLIGKLNTLVDGIYQQLFKGEKLTLKYVTNVPEESDQEQFILKYREKIERIKSEERIKKTTLVGIQRDDLKAYLGNKEVYAYASQGQNRLVTLALNLAISKILEEHFKDKPILLLDDVFSDLDNSRQKDLINYLKKENQQVFITTANKVDEKEVNLYHIENEQLIGGK